MDKIVDKRLAELIDAVRLDRSATCEKCGHSHGSYRVRLATDVLLDAIRARVKREDSSPLSETAA